MCKVWVDGIVVKGRTPQETLENISQVLGRLMENRLFAAAQRCVFSTRFIKWCGKPYSAPRVQHVRQRVERMVKTRRPETGWELMQFLQAVSWMRTSLIALAEVVGQLRTILYTLLTGTSRTKRAEANREIKEEDWTEDRLAPWEGAKAVLQNAVTLACPKAGCGVCVFPDASGLYEGCSLT